MFILHYPIILLLVTVYTFLCVSLNNNNVHLSWLISALSAHTIHINLNMIFYTHVEHSLTKTVYILKKYYTKTTTTTKQKATTFLLTLLMQPHFGAVSGLVERSRCWCVFCLLVSAVLLQPPFLPEQLVSLFHFFIGFHQCSV